MTVPSEVSSASYTGNGVTTLFSTAFYFLATSEVRVTVSDIVKTEGVHYTVTAPVSVGAAGSVTFLVAPIAAAPILIERVVPFTQATSFRAQGEFSPAVHEDQVDEVVFQTQQLDRRLKALESAGAPGSVIAGNGVYFASTTLNVGVTGTSGIVSNHDDISVAWGGAPGDVTKAAASAGAANTVARSDHKHDVTTAAPVSTAVQMGNAAAEGTATTLARSDHQHAVADGLPANVTKSAASNGVAATIARSDHKHDVVTAAAVDLTDSTSGEGGASSLSRSDHTHSHGARAGGTLHAVATTTTAGFMSSTDKAKLDGVPTAAGGSKQTADATPTSALVIATATNYSEVITVDVIARKQGAGGNTGGYKLVGTFRNIDGVVTQVGTTTAVATHETDAAWDAAFTISSPNVVVTVTGAAATTINWQVIAQRVAVSNA